MQRNTDDSLYGFLGDSNLFFIWPKQKVTQRFDTNWKTDRFMPLWSKTVALPKDRPALRTNPAIFLKAKVKLTLNMWGYIDDQLVWEQDKYYCYSSIRCCFIVNWYTYQQLSRTAVNHLIFSFSYFLERTQIWFTRVSIFSWMFFP